jgi:hypothetical protein
MIGAFLTYGQKEQSWRNQAIGKYESQPGKRYS